MTANKILPEHLMISGKIPRDTFPLIKNSVIFENMILLEMYLGVSCRRSLDVLAVSCLQSLDVLLGDSFIMEVIRCFSVYVDGSH
jgi:hypothetical protein